MKIQKPLIFIFTCAATLAFGQSNLSASDKRISVNGFFAIGRSTFNSSPSAPSKFPTLEMRAGVGAAKSLGETFELRTRLNFGVKFKREPFNEEGSVVVGPPFMDLDELASDRNHFFYEIPLLLQANLKHPQIGLRFGCNYRRFFPDNSDVDALTARGDFGLLAGASYRLRQKMSLGFEYCYGLTKIISSGGTVDGSEYHLDVRNNFAQVVLEYSF